MSVRDELAGMLSRRVLVCDGAMGTVLHAVGNSLDQSLVELNLSNPALVRSVHDSYVEAGADIVQTNTFGASRLRLAGYGYADAAAEINRAGVAIARAAAEAAGHRVFVAGSVSPAVTVRQRAKATPKNAARHCATRSRPSPRRGWTWSCWRRSATSASSSRRSTWPARSATCR
ncbi:homocysteine S-methyltransferase family protein [Phytohabitans flavus]|uniref:homocysteine S-methyltransferase family protein n=1 Tax=Phytohabitans flavus TaxID=1076124 RepID=UPI003632BCA7